MNLSQPIDSLISLNLWAYDHTMYIMYHVCATYYLLV